MWLCCCCCSDVSGQGRDDQLPVQPGVRPEEHDGPAGPAGEGEGRRAEDPAEHGLRDGGEDQPLPGPGGGGAQGRDQSSAGQAGPAGEDRGEDAQLTRGLQVDPVVQTNQRPVGHAR